MANPKILELFPNPAPAADYVIEHTHHEFTSVCPITGHPDFAEITHPVRGGQEVRQAQVR